MLLKNFTDFLFESKKIDVKFMSNIDRKSIKDFFSIINTSITELLPDYVKTYEGDCDDKIASYLYDPFKHKEVLTKYFLKDYGYKDFMDLIDREGSKWNDRCIDSSEFVDSINFELIDILQDYKIMDSTHNIIFLSEEEDKSIPALITIDKYRL